MDVDKNKILSKNNTYQRKNKEISLISPRNNNTNKIGLVININNQKGRYNKVLNSNDNLKNKTYRNNTKTINEITLNCLEKENSLLKKEIEIVKSNLIISDKKEQINKKTIQEIKRMNKEKENSYKNMINLINEYKTREIDFLNKIKEIENESKKKEEELMTEISLYKAELINKDEIIKELNNKINELTERIMSLKKIINEKNRILLFLTKKNKSQKFKRASSINNIFNARTMVSSKSCGNIISRIMDFKNLNISNNIKPKTGLKEILLNDEEYNENKKVKIIKKQSYFRKRIPNNRQFNDNNAIKNKNILKKYYMNRNEHNNNSLNYSLKNIERNVNTNVNLNINTNISSNQKRNEINGYNKNNIKEILINNNKINLSLENKNETKGKITRNYSFIINDLENRKNQIKTLKEINKNKNINCNTIGNKKSKPENMKGLYSKKNKLVEINNNLTSANSPSFISNYSFQSIFPSFQNK